MLQALLALTYRAGVLVSPAHVTVAQPSRVVTLSVITTRIRGAELRLRVTACTRPAHIAAAAGCRIAGAVHTEDGVGTRVVCSRITGVAVFDGQCMRVAIDCA
jgi:hypothetical protein